MADFGLVTSATPTDEAQSPGCGPAGDASEPNSLQQHSLNQNESQTREVGTQLYMSPEQSQGQQVQGSGQQVQGLQVQQAVEGSAVRRVRKYDFKVDVFALGVILFELLCPLRTEMERVQTVQTLRRTQKAPGDLRQSRPADSALVERMVAADPNGRPASSDLPDLARQLPLL